MCEIGIFKILSMHLSIPIMTVLLPVVKLLNNTMDSGLLDRGVGTRHRHAELVVLRSWI